MTAGIKANADGSAAIQVGGSDAITITSGLAVSMNGGVVYPLIAGTAVASTSGTSIDFTSIPSWVKRITVMFNGVSGNGSSNFIIQLGDSGGIETTGYLGASFNSGTSAFNSTGFNLTCENAASQLWHGSITITNISGNIWCESGVIGGTGSGYTGASGGSKTLSDVLDRLRLTTVNGTDAFDAGSINILYE
jgi:hypothetical protein